MDKNDEMVERKVNKIEKKEEEVEDFYKFDDKMITDKNQKLDPLKFDDPNIIIETLPHLEDLKKANLKEGNISLPFFLGLKKLLIMT